MKRAVMAQIAENIASTIKLNDGVIIPLFGLGTFKAEEVPGGCETAVVHAIENGYRMFDTAQIYETEPQVGRGIKRSGLNREDVFVVTKLWKTNHGRKQAPKSVKESLKRLGLDYVDLFLIHTPIGSKLVETYTAMLDLKKQGLIKSVGVSNFGVQHLEGLKNAGLDPPSVNQIELHPFQQKLETVKYCQENNITLMGFSPLAKGQKMEDPDLNAMANKYGKSVGQLMIRWSIQHGYITIPKSAKPQRIEENAQVFDWSISDEDLAKLNELPDWRCAWDVMNKPWLG